MAQAIKRLYPDTKLAIGPSIDDGFYYDFDREKAFTHEEHDHTGNHRQQRKIPKQIHRPGHKTIDRIAKHLPDMLYPAFPGQTANQPIYTIAVAQLRQEK